jgi:beta propeller repeat protein
MKKLTTAMLALLLFAPVTIAQWLTVPVTTNTTYDTHPDVSSGRIVWRGWSGDSHDIFIRERDGTITNLTQTPAYHEDRPRIADTRVVWRGPGGLQLLDEEGIGPIPGGGSPYNVWDIGGTVVVWEGFDGGADSEIFLYDALAGVTTQLTVNGVEDRSPTTDGRTVVWWAGQGDANDEVMMYRDGSIRQVSPEGTTYHNGGGRDPAVSGNRIVYVGGRDGLPDGILLYDITSSNTTALSSENETQIYPTIDGDLVTWTAVRSGAYDIVVYDLTSGEAVRITDTAEEDRWSRISGTDLVWRAFDGVDYEVYSAAKLDLFMSMQLPTISWTELGTNWCYTVESCSSLVDAAWQPCVPTNQWPISTNTWSVPLQSASRVFFRVKATSYE